MTCAYERYQQGHPDFTQSGKKTDSFGLKKGIQESLKMSWREGPPESFRPEPFKRQHKKGERLSTHARSAGKGEGPKDKTAVMWAH